MKRLFLIGALLGVGSLTTYAQTVTVMAEQLAALDALAVTVKEGYHIADDGLEDIGQITDDEYHLHQAYFGSLAAVSPPVDEDPKLTALRNLQAELVQQVNAALEYWKKQRSLQP
jgi:hypothetical protein